MEVMTRQRINHIPCSPYAESEIISGLCRGISKVLSRWIGLQLAIQNEWGGHDTVQKSEQLVVDILSWFCQGTRCVEDLENLLHESMLFSFNTEIEDGSIEEVAEQLIIMHDECLHGTHGHM